MHSNLPPGVTVHDIPGNREIDHAYDRACEKRQCIACVDYDECGEGPSGTCPAFAAIYDMVEFEERMNVKRE